jgi:hypothetical protein
MYRIEWKYLSSSVRISIGTPKSKKERGREKERKGEEMSPTGGEITDRKQLALT